MKRLRRRYKRSRRLGSYFAIGFLIIALAVGTLAYLQSGSSASIQSPIASTPTASRYVLKLNGAITPSSAGPLIAVSEGLFQRRGLSVELRHGINDADVTSAVAADDRVIGLASAQGFLKARAEGLPIVAFAASYAISSVEFFALSSVKLLGPRDLEGKRIGYEPSPEIATILYAFIEANSIAQSGMTIVESDHSLSDLENGKIDILIGHLDVEGQALERAGIPYRSLSPDSFSVHGMGPVYFANEQALSSPGDLENFLIAIASGWNDAYSDYDRTISVIARAIDDKLSSGQISHFMDAQRRLLRPYGARFGELDPRQFRVTQAQLLQQRIIREPIDLSRAVNYDVLTDVYRANSDVFSRIEP
jgi:putative hydroxymethylpyrimidine transport system substrate-binding protein